MGDFFSRKASSQLLLVPQSSTSWVVFPDLPKLTHTSGKLEKRGTEGGNGNMIYCDEFPFPLLHDLLTYPCVILTIIYFQGI